MGWIEEEIRKNQLAELARQEERKRAAEQLKLKTTQDTIREQARTRDLLLRRLEEFQPQAEILLKGVQEFWGCGKISRENGDIERRRIGMSIIHTYPFVFCTYKEVTSYGDGSWNSMGSGRVLDTAEIAEGKDFLTIATTIEGTFSLFSGTSLYEDSDYRGTHVFDRESLDELRRFIVMDCETRRHYNKLPLQNEKKGKEAVDLFKNRRKK